MTIPIPDPQPPTPSKAKAWWALIIPQVPALVSLLAQFTGSIPAPYGAVFAAVLSLIGAVSGVIVHQVKYLPPDTVIAPAAPATPSAGSWPTPPPA